MRPFTVLIGIFPGTAASRPNAVLTATSTAAGVSSFPGNAKGRGKRPRV
jgi:hypothetical protein